jgi:hypothetical protein
MEEYGSGSGLELVLRILCEFLPSLNWMHSEKKDRERARRKAEKEELGLLYAVICFVLTL